MIKEYKLLILNAIDSKSKRKETIFRNKLSKMKKLAKEMRLFTAVNL